MKITRGAASLFGLAMLLWTASIATGQSEPEVRRARPVDEPAVRRAVPADESIENALRALKDDVSEPSSRETEGADQRQLDYANGLFTRKLYDLAIPEYQKYLEDYPGRAGRANAYFSLGECYRNLHRDSNARANLQKVLTEYGDSEFAGPAAFALAEMAFTDKDYATALPLFHRSAGKSNEPAVALSALYFEARCLDALGNKDEAADIYAQVAETGNPNPYREDARVTAASIFAARGKKLEALKQYEALANEAQKPALKAECAVRGGLIALELVQADKSNKSMTERAAALFQKGRTLPESGKFRAIAQVGFRRLQYETGQYAQLLADYKKELDKLPEAAQAEVLLFAANSERQLGHPKEAEALYHQIITKYPGREEAKDAAYQQLINVYNSDPSGLSAAVDQFLATNPTNERADQAKLLKAEALYKQQSYTEAASLYGELRASELSPRLRAEAAYKLGLCHVQTKDTPGVIEAFTYYLQTFPDTPQIPAALAQRALAYEQSKNYAAALTDLNIILAKYPKTREREAALQLKALILGQQDNTKGMVDTFRQLLKEYPKSSVAAQAHYYIGKTAFEAKEYKTALTSLNTARQLNKEQYYNLASVRIILCQFYLRDRPALTKEVNNFLAESRNGGTNVPPEVLEWLGIEYYNEKNFQAAEKYLSALRTTDTAAKVKPDYLFYLGDAATKLKNLPEAEEAFAKYLQTAKDPAGKAKVLLTLGAVKISAHKPDEAQKIAEEIMVLQPEGRVNAEARLLAGEVQLERGNFDDAGKAFKGVALLYDDPAITPRALDKAAVSFRQAGNTEEADRLSRELRERYPNYVSG
jgi:TolA-binding protein